MPNAIYLNLDSLRPQKTPSQSPSQSPTQPVTTPAQSSPLPLPSLQTGVKIDLTMPIGVIDKAGRININNYINTIKNPARFFEDRCLYKLPDWWDYKTQVGGKGEYVGGFCKRVAKYYYQENGYKLSSDQMGVIGDIMSKHTNKNTYYTIDYTQQLNWNAGDFGDSGSCFWSCHSAARDSLKEDGAYAIRFFEQSDNEQGIARAWVCETKIHEKQADVYVVFNGYGLETSDIARIMAYHLGLSYRRIELTNNGEKEGLIWINGSDKEDGGTGFIIGEESVVNSVSEIDLSLEDSRMFCYNCDDHVSEDCSRTYEGDTYCESCFNEHFSFCEDCEEYYPVDDVTYVESDGIFICPDCLRDSYTYCDKCYEYHKDDEVTNIQHVNVCDYCRDEDYTMCNSCEEYVKNDRVIEIDDESYCSDCTDLYFAICENCGDFFRYNGRDLCPECKEEKDEQEEEKLEKEKEELEKIERQAARTEQIAKTPDMSYCHHMPIRE